MKTLRKNSAQTLRRICSGSVALLLSFAAEMPATGAVTLDWDPNAIGPTNGGSGVWNLTNVVWFNPTTSQYVVWDNSTNGGDTIAEFKGPSTVTVDNGAGLEIRTGGLQFVAGDSTVSGGTLTLFPPGLGTPTIFANPGLNVKISTNLTGATGLDIVGAGSTITLEGNNTYTGETVVKSGTVILHSLGFGNPIPHMLTIGDHIGAGDAKVITHASNQIDFNSQVNVNEDGIFDMDFNSQGFNFLSIRSTGPTGGIVDTHGSILAVNSISFSGGQIISSTAGGTLTVNDEIIAFSATQQAIITADVLLQLGTPTTITVMPGSSLPPGTPEMVIAAHTGPSAGQLIKEGTGTLRLTNTVANEHTGGTFVNNGTLELDATPFNGAIPGDLTIGDGVGAAGSAVVRLILGAEIFDNSHVTLKSDGLFDLNGAVERVGSIAGDAGSSIALGTNGGLSAGSNDTSTTFAGSISGSGTITKEGAGTWTWSGDNTFTADVKINAGTLLLSAIPTSNAGITGTNITIGDGNGVAGSAILSNAELGENINNSAAVTIHNDGLWEIHLFSETVGSVEGDAGSQISLVDATSRLLTGGNNASTTFAGSISGAGSIVKQGTGTWLLSGINSFTGSFTLANGEVDLSAPVGNKGITGSQLIIGDGIGAAGSAVLRNVVFGENIVDTAAVVIHPDGLLDLTNHGETIGSLAGDAGASVNITNSFLNVGGDNTSTTYDGTILGPSSTVRKSGTGTWTLTGANSYSNTVINSGTVATTNAAALGGPASGTVFLNTSAVLAPTNALNVGALTWNGGNIHLAPGVTPDIVNVTGAFDNGGAGGAYALVGTGLTLGTTYTLTTFNTTDFTVGQFSAVAAPETPDLTPQGQFLLNGNNVQFTLTGITAGGPIIQNSAPVNTPTFADFVVNGPVKTGGPTDNNQVQTLTFTPGSSLQIFNTLTVTNGPVNLVPNSSIQLGQPGGPNGNLNTSQLNVGANSFLGGNGTIIGNLYNNGLVSPGNSPGHIHVSGNYQQGPQGTLRIEIAGFDPAQHDLLSVGGTAQLDGTLQLVSLNNQFKLKRGQKVTFLTSNQGVIGEFAKVENPFSSDTIVEPTVVYRQNSVALEGVQGSFKKFANRRDLTENQKAVASALDSIAFRNHPPKVIEYLDERKLVKLPGDFDKIAPEELTSVFTLGVSLANVQSGNIQRRADDIRSGSGGFSAAGLALNGDNPSYSGRFGSDTGAAGPSGNGGKEITETTPTVAEENRWGVFLSGTGEWVSVGDTGNARGYDLTSGGFTLGIDYKVTPNFAIGLAAGYTGSSADLTDRGRVYVNGGKIGLYATFFQNEQVTAPSSMSKDAKEVQAPVSYNIAKGFYADVAVFGGYNSYDFRRSALQGEARGDTDGGELNVLAGIGYDFKRGNLTFGPTASFNYTYLGTSDFTEHGSLAPLNVHGGKGESLRTAFGFKASYDWKVGSVLIKPEIRAAWQHEFGDATYALDSDFANGAGNSFRVNGPNLGRDSALLGAGFAIQFNERFSTYFYYDGELGRKDYQSTSVTGGVRLTF